MLTAKHVHGRLTGKIISIDRKTVCGVKSERRKPIHMVSAWITDLCC